MAPLGFILLGAVIAVVCLFTLTLVERPTTLSLEELRREYIQEYAKRQQAELGVNCVELPGQFNSLLDTVEQIVLSRRAPGEDWRPLVTAAIEHDLEKYSDSAFHCRALYLEGQNGIINGLQNLQVLEEIHNDFALLIVLLRLGPRKNNCDAQCRDGMFDTLRKAHAETAKKIRSSRSIAH